MNAIDTIPSAMTTTGPAAFASRPSMTPAAQAAEPFAQALQRATDRDTARVAATQLVSTLFVRPILQSVRESVLNQGGAFAPGAAERRFGPLLDERLADEITGAAAFPLVETVVDRLVGRAASSTPQENDA